MAQPPPKSGPSSKAVFWETMERCRPPTRLSENASMVWDSLGEVNRPATAFEISRRVGLSSSAMNVAMQELSDAELVTITKRGEHRLVRRRRRQLFEAF